MVSPGWTPERTKQLTELWEKGLSASQVAKELRWVTRNAVIGKVCRLGLNSRSAAVVAEALRLGHRQEEPRQPAKPKPLVQPKTSRRSHGEPAFGAGGVQLNRKPPMLPQDAQPDELTPLVTIDGLHNRACKWPIGDPRAADFGFCGRLRRAEDSYCGAHKQRAYRAPLALTDRTEAQLAGDAKRRATMARKASAPRVNFA